LIEAGCLAHFVTHNPVGGPHVALIWIRLDGDELVAGHLPENRKESNIRRDPRVAISLHANTKSAMGLTAYAVLYGRAQLEAGGAPGLLQRFAAVYLGTGVNSPPMPNPPPGFMPRAAIEKVSRLGPWTGRPV
jgi:hypothetical protein